MAQETGSSLLGNLRKVITLVDQLRDIGLNDYIKLPRIVVLGIQSAGKSSLLEHIVGIDFLPRGSGVVTRRPLELRLSYAPESVCSQPTAEFIEEIKGRKFTNFEEVRKNIEDLTDKVCGSSKNIVDKPIILAVQGPHCPDLTLVDLPGITRIPIHDQPKNIEEITTNMAKRYCEDPSAIILCVVAANADMTTSDALLLAKKLDPDGMQILILGVRTMGVLTKIDIMDQGTNAIKMLKGEEVNLKYGYVGVKLRSQQDIKDNIPITQAVLREKNFFANHPVYSTIPGEIFGTQVLTGKLTRILYRRIRSFLPSLMKEIDQRIGKVQSRLNILGPGLPIEDSDKMHFIWQLVHEFARRFRNSISGQYEKQKSGKSTMVPAGSKIKLLFQELYEEFNDLEYCSLKKFSDDDIVQVIQKYQAQSIPGFLPVDAFYALLNPELKKLYTPALETLDQAYSILEDYAVEILESQLEQIPSVMKMLEEQIIDVIQSCKRNAHDAVVDVLEAEQNYIFTNDFNYLSGKPFIKFGQEQNSGKVQKGNPMVFELRSKIEHYFKLVVRATRDNIPKLIGYFLVKGCQTKMLMQLQQNLMQNQSILNVIQEDVSIVEERKKLSREVETFKNAQKIIKRDPDLSEYVLNSVEEQQEQQVTQKPREASPPKPVTKDIPKQTEKPPQKPNEFTVNKQVAEPVTLPKEKPQQQIPQQQSQPAPPIQKPAVTQNPPQQPLSQQNQQSQPEPVKKQGGLFPEKVVNQPQPNPLTVNKQGPNSQNNLQAPPIPTKPAEEPSPVRTTSTVEQPQTQQTQPKKGGGIFGFIKK